MNVDLDYILNLNLRIFNFEYSSHIISIHIKDKYAEVMKTKYSHRCVQAYINERAKY